MLLESPTRLKFLKTDISPLQLTQLKTGLTYTDQKAVYLLRRFKKNGGRWLSEEDYKEKVKELQAQTKVCLLFEEGDYYWTYSGLARKVAGCGKGEAAIKWQFTYPEPKSLPWDKKPEFEMYPYQSEALEALLRVRHGGVQMATGLGKSFIIANLTKRLGLKTVIMAPSTSIADQLYQNFSKWFGIKYVGAFYDGKKSCKKLITIGTAQSFTRIEEGSPNWKELSKVDVFIADESHQCPASTLAKVCFGVLAHAPYRFFFSATQMRNDGLDLLLDGITGPIVYEMTLREGVDQGFLAKPIFHMRHVPPNGSFKFDDPNEATRHHLYYNPNVVDQVAKLVNYAYKAGMPVLVLIEEVEQFTKLVPHLIMEAGFAHGTLNEENRKRVPEPYWKSDPNDLVEKFNKGDLKVLVGTSCIATGTDIKPVRFLVYWQGGKSEIQVKQAIGRGTRLFPGKTTCHVVDFCVFAPEPGPDEDEKPWWTTENHAKARQQIYEELYGPVQVSHKLM